MSTTHAPEVHAPHGSHAGPHRNYVKIWAILLGFLIWNQLPDALSLVGILILASAGLYTFYREQQLRRRRLQKRS